MNPKKLIILFLLCTPGLWLSAQTHISPRSCINFNREWKYMRGDIKGAEQPTYNDREWESIGIPHSFSIPYFMSNEFYIGYGWYRKLFRLTEEDLSQKIFLEFDGVFQEAEIFINGQQAGRHVGGYTGFQADISSLVQAGDNLVAVRVNNIWKPNVAPRAGEHVFSGGIYRNVRLTKKSPVHIDWYGTFVTTPDLGRNQGKASAVRVETEICNHSGKDGEYRLVTRILSPEGKVIATVENKETLAAHSAKTVFQTTKRLRTPSLWHPEHPVLYKVISSLYKGKELLDCDETAFGFRWFEWTADQGFFLNGKHLFFKGANVHQDQAGWGDACLLYTSPSPRD